MVVIIVKEVKFLDKNIESIITSRGTNEEKLKILESLSQDIQTAKDIINVKYTYCEECGDYYLSKSFFVKTKTKQTKICIYEDPINSGGNDYVDGYADITYRICPKGHKHIVDSVERRK